MNKKSVLDKFYTKQEVAKQLIDTIPGTYDLWLEPSAGAGAFLKHLPTPRLGLDIDPDDDEYVTIFVEPNPIGDSWGRIKR